MKWYVRGSEPLFDYLEWHPHFAWRPVQIGNQKYWLCTVMRRAIWHGDNMELQKDAINRVIDTCRYDAWEYAEPEYRG